MPGWVKPPSAAKGPSKKDSYRAMQRDTEKAISEGKPFGMKLLGKQGKAAAKRYGDGKVIEKGVRP